MPRNQAPPPSAGIARPYTYARDALLDPRTQATITPQMTRIHNSPNSRIHSLGIY